MTLAIKLQMKRVCKFFMWNHYDCIILCPSNVQLLM